MRHLISHSYRCLCSLQPADMLAAVQNVDSGEIAMQAFADPAAISETLQTGLATFYSRSRKGRWCKGETSGNFIKVSAG